MKALYIDCCVREEESRSAKLAQAFLENLSPEYEVTHRRLMEEALYPLTAETLRHGTPSWPRGGRTIPASASPTRSRRRTL